MDQRTLSEMLIPRIIHYGLRSQDDLSGCKKLWNSLPKDVCSCNDVGVFKSKLKTHYCGNLCLHILLVLQLLDNYLVYVGCLY